MGKKRDKREIFFEILKLLKKDKASKYSIREKTNEDINVKKKLAYLVKQGLVKKQTFEEDGEIYFVITEKGEETLSALKEVHNILSR